MLHPSLWMDILTVVIPEDALKTSAFLKICSQIHLTLTSQAASLGFTSSHIYSPKKFSVSSDAAIKLLP